MRPQRLLGKLEFRVPNFIASLVLGLALLALWIPRRTASAVPPHGKKDWPAPDEARKLKNPVRATAEGLASAQAIYMDKCAQCHGEKGKGDGPEAMMYSEKPADFTDAHMMGEMTEGEIFWKIGTGRDPMPAFKKQLTEEHRWELVHFLRSFAAKPAPKPAKSPAAKRATSARQPE